MTSPFDPEETHDGNESTEHHLFDDPNSLTWGAADPDFDALLRERLGPLPTMPTPPYAFERVLVAGRRRRARKVWAGAAAAAFVVMAGTAGTTVAFSAHGSSGGAVIGEGNSGSASTSGAASSASASASATPSVSASPSATAAPSSAVAATTSSPSPTESIPECASDTFTLAVTNANSVNDELLIVLTNTSGHSCTTYGYPGLQLETESGQLQSTTVTRVNKSAVEHLTVGANQTISTIATFSVETGSATAGAGCLMPSYSLAVIPPNQKQQIVATISGGPVTVCGNGVLDTPPLVMGSTGA
ncbi:MAG TPA: DUF4232 domain-containing protein [Actinospica sp.]|nr:DUF4232 domain-containing protein [Actinospica sp.]